MGFPYQSIENDQFVCSPARCPATSPETYFSSWAPTPRCCPCWSRSGCLAQWHSGPELLRNLTILRGNDRYDSFFFVFLTKDISLCKIYHDPMTDINSFGSSLDHPWEVCALLGAGDLLGIFHDCWLILQIDLWIPRPWPMKWVHGSIGWARWASLYHIAPHVTCPQS